MTGEKRLRKTPTRFSPWVEGDKHPPMATRKKQAKDKKDKLKEKDYQKRYRETMDKEKKKEYNRAHWEKKKLQKTKKKGKAAKTKE